MTPITELALPFASIGGFLVFAYGVGRLVTRLTKNDETHAGQLADAKTERQANAAKLETLDGHRESHGTRLTKIEGKLE